MPFRSSLFLAVLVLAGVFSVPSQARPQRRASKAAVYLSPNLHVGQHLGNVFSRAISYKADGIDELAFRTSGTGAYVVTADTPADVVFDSSFRYDGRPESRGKTEIKDGGATVCWNEKCSAETDASGPLYNPLIWGEPEGKLRLGMSWSVSIAQPWELGPAGQETITIVELDRATHSVTLKREGQGDGYFDNDIKKVRVTKAGKTYLVDVAPGHAHWAGYTRFREGVVMSDELVVERPVTLKSAELGEIPAQQREYVLLNASPSA
ncbi:MAG TPA: hypothetical protein VN745_08680 [Verrucomicrobiae bacterium]|nr:hypothetical protein [Verrucomicrobiae bacterium]